MLLEEASLSDALLCRLNMSSPFLSLQLGFDLDREVYPLVVHAVVDEGDGNGRFRSSFAVLAALSRCTDRAAAVASGTTCPLHGDQADSFSVPLSPRTALG